MQVYNATKKWWMRKAIAGVLVILGLMVVGVSNSQAQMTYSGGFVPHYHHPTVFPGWGGMPAAPLPTTSPPIYFPDNDSYYPGGQTASYASPLGPSAAMLPWNHAGFEEYDSFTEAAPEKSYYSTPRKYALEAKPLPVSSPALGLEPALLIVHLPQHALLWVEGKQVSLKGPSSSFNSPLLDPGKEYAYKVRAVWLEEGRWVSQTQKIPIEAGAIQTLYLRRNALPKRE